MGEHLTFGLDKDIKVGYKRAEKMAYKRKIYRFLNAIEVEDCHDGKYGAPGMSREQKKKATPEQIEKQNQYQKEKRCRHRLRKHFDVNDYFITLTYAQDRRPQDMDQAKKDIGWFTRQLRKEYRKAGQELKWIRNLECGSRGAWHVHMVINRIPDLDLTITRLWQHGMVDIKLLYQKGEFAELAKYLTKTPRTETRLREACYSTSKNLPLPEPEKSVHQSWKITDKIRVPKGWYLDKESFHEGINPITGHPFRAYTLIRLQRRTERKKRRKHESAGSENARKR